MPALIAGSSPVRRRAAAASVGRVHRPVHDRGQDDHPPPARQARRPADDPHRPRGRLPNRGRLMRSSASLIRLLPRRRPVLRVQLALLDWGVFVGLVVVLFLASSVLFGTANVLFGHSQVAYHPGAAAVRQGATGTQFTLGPFLIAVALI